MIIFFQSGQLGNQIFQYLAMKKFDNDAKVIFFGADALVKVFDLEIINISLPKKENNYLYKLFFRIASQFLPRVLLFLSDSIRLISSVEESRSSNGSKFLTKYGLIKKIVFFKKSYYQCEDICQTPAAKNLRIHQHIIKEAKKKIDQFKLYDRELYFIHIRRGDFIYWPSSSSPAVVPVAWFIKQMKAIQTKQPHAKFLIFSNDKPYIEEFFSNYSECLLVNETEEIEFAMMSLCYGGGILSPSTFAWWAAFICQRDLSNPVHIAPRYWIGHRSGKWYPPGIQTDWIQYD